MKLGNIDATKEELRDIYNKVGINFDEHLNRIRKKRAKNVLILIIVICFYLYDIMV